MSMLTSNTSLIMMIEDVCCMAENCLDFFPFGILTHLWVPAITYFSPEFITQILNELH
jgi:hypothetical protein